MNIGIHREWHLTITRRDGDHWPDISKDGPVGKIVFRPDTVTVQFAEIGGDVVPGAVFVYGRRLGAVSSKPGRPWLARGCWTASRLPRRGSGVPRYAPGEPSWRTRERGCH